MCRYGRYAFLLLLFPLCGFYVFYVYHIKLCLCVKLLTLPSCAGLPGRRDLVSQWDLLGEVKYD